MDRRLTREEFLATVDRELTETGLAVTGLRIDFNETLGWLIEFRVGERMFAVGLVQRDGFLCEETTPGRKIDFTRDADGSFSASENVLRRRGFQMVKYAVDHPDFMGLVRPVV